MKRQFIHGKNVVKPDIAIQKDVGTKNSDGSTLKNIWLELPAYCNLACSYCYANGGKPNDVENLLNWENYVSILNQAKIMGVEDIGIPGAGEPFIPKNKDLTFKLLEKAKDLGFYVTLFTTGEWISEEIADKLYDLPVEVMLKGNSLDPEIQDAFVSNPKNGRFIEGYGKKRNQAIELLINKGFNNQENCIEKYGRKSRMALVTSIMTSADGGPSNYESIEHLLRFARENNIILDVDTLLERGRAASCNLCEQDQRLRDKFLKLQKIDREEFGNKWEISQSYIGTSCDRFSYHMYIDQYGNIRPCIGAMDVDLGNIKNISLQDAWDREERKIIRNRQYGGTCTTCKNFNTINEERTEIAGTIKYDCNSCLGRRTEDLTNEFLLKNGFVKTIGCWNYSSLEGKKEFL